MVRSCRLSSEAYETFQNDYEQRRGSTFDEMINLEGIDFNKNLRRQKKVREGRRKQISNSSPIPVVPFVPKALPSRGRLL